MKPKKFITMEMPTSADILIPESVALRFFNRATGASCKSLEETRDYLRTHEDAEARIVKFICSRQHKHKWRN